MVTRSSNNYGPYQFPEKLIPLFITNAMNDESLPVYGDGLNVRDWIHVRDNCEGVLAVLERGVPGEIYNIGGRNERTNLEVTKSILHAVGKDESLITYVKDRPGHDRRYALSTDKIERELGWTPRIQWADGLADTVAWYQSNTEWWNHIKSGAYREYYAQHYSTLGLES
jgi:dTDP-glucose 4,6-dehydratase